MNKKTKIKNEFAQLEKKFPENKTNKQTYTHNAKTVF